MVWVVVVTACLSFSALVLDCLTHEDGSIDSPETSVDNYQSTLRKSQKNKYLIHTETETCYNAGIWNYRDIVNQ
jgi:hypothetical protein